MTPRLRNKVVLGVIAKPDATRVKIYEVNKSNMLFFKVLTIETTYCADR